MADTVVDTGLQRIVPQAEIIDTKAEESVGGFGAVDMVTGLEERPCCMCKSFEDSDPDKLIRHIISKGLRPRPDGKFESPIQDDFKSSGQVRANLVLDPKGAGYCRRDTIVVEGLATCPAWQPTRTISEFQQRMLRRRR
jgi:hypothetical protein